MQLFSFITGNGEKLTRSQDCRIRKKKLPLERKEANPYCVCVFGGRGIVAIEAQKGGLAAIKLYAS